MKNLSENELFERLSARRGDYKITHAEIASPDYEVWGRAREWEYHQAVCLVAGMVPLSKSYFNLLIANQSPADLIHWLSYYPLSPQDHNRLINLDLLLKPLIPNQKISPTTLLALCKVRDILGKSFPDPLALVIKEFGSHPSLNLPTIFHSIELNPSVYINAHKNKKDIHRFATPAKDVHPTPPPIAPQPSEKPLALCKRLYSLECSDRWKDADGLSLNEIVLLHYGIDPRRVYQSHFLGEVLDESAKEFSTYLSRYFYGHHQFLINALDERLVADLLHRSVAIGQLKASRQGLFPKEDVIEWMRSKNLSFPFQASRERENMQGDLKQAILSVV